jgi:hypothetical protein
MADARDRAGDQVARLTPGDSSRHRARSSLARGIQQGTSVRYSLMFAMCARVVVSLVLLGLPSTVLAATQWGDLQPGPHAVGYRTLHVRDVQRRYFDEPRVLQIYMWYPAAASTNGRYMPYGRYLDDAALDWGESPERVASLAGRVRAEFRSGALNPSFPGGLSDSAFMSVLATPARVVRDAPPAADRFPVLLHAHMQGALHQSVMLEYLASHGYVVLSISTYNSAPAYYGRGDDTADALLNLTEDLSLMLAQAASLPFADASRAAMIGMLAHGGIALQMKAEPLRAIACVECLGYTDILQQLPFHDPRRLRIPMLEMINSSYEGAATGQQHSALERFPSAHRYVVRLKGVEHSDFYPFPKVARPGAAHQKFDAVIQTLRQFLDATLRDDNQAREHLARSGPVPGMPADFLRVTEHRAAAAPLPTEAEFLGWLRYGPVDDARAAWRTHGRALVSRARMFTTVLFLARDREKHAPEAVAMFREGFPAEAGSMEARQDAMLTQLLESR